MTTESVDIQVQGTVKPGIATDLKAIAASALGANTAVEKLQTMLSKLDSGGLGAVQRIQQTVTKATKEATAAATDNSAAMAANKARLLELAKAGVAEAQAQRDVTNAYFESEKALKTYNTSAKQTVQYTQEQITAAQNATKAARDKRIADTAASKATSDLGKAQDTVNKTLNTGGQSAKQYANNLRGIPAQFTDIIVSLQGGQKPLTVLLQQGGQLKDMFGGVGNAARALGGYVLGLISPFTVLAAAAGALVVAYYQANQESTAFTNALILTGNTAGTSASQLGSMAQSISKTVGTVGAASAVLAQLAASTKIPADSFEMLATAALKFEQATGTAASETVANFEKIARDPVKTTLELNENLNYLTASVYRQIKALQDQGNTQAAATIAEQQYSSALSSRADSIKANLGVVERSWDSLKNAAKRAWDAILDIDRPDTFEQKMAKLQTQLENAKAIGTGSRGGGNRGTAQIQSEMQSLTIENTEKLKRAAAEETSQKARAQALSDEQYLDKIRDSTQSNAKKRAKELADYQAVVNRRAVSSKTSNDPSLAISAKEQAETIANINDKYKDKKDPNAKLEETRATSLAKINLQLDNQIERMTQLQPMREQQQQFDQIEEQLTGKKITLNASETASIKEKIAAIAQGQQVQQQYDRIYQETTQASKDYNATLTAAKMLLDSNVITQAQYNAQIAQAKEAYDNFLDPLLKYRKELEFQASTLGLTSDQIQIATQRHQIEQEALRNGIALRKQDVDALMAQYEAQQKVSAVSQAYQQIVSSSSGQLEDFTAKQTALKMAYDNGVIGLQSYQAQMVQLQSQAALLRISLDQALPGDTLSATFGALLQGYQGLAAGLTSSLSNMFVTLEDGFSSAIGNVLAGTQSLNDALRNVAQQAVSQLIASLVKMGIQWALNAALGQTLATTATGASVIQAGITASAWAPAAAAVSLASFGTNAVAASAGMTSTFSLASILAAIPGFQTGGYTGGGAADKVAGVVHAGEYVMTADTVSRLGLGTMDAIQSGRTVTATASNTKVASSGSSGNKQTVTAGNTYVNFVEDASKAGSTESRKENADTYITGFVSNIREQGEAASILERAYGLKRVGQ